MVRLILGIVFGVLAVIYIVQNTQAVEVTLLFWTVTVPRSIMYILGMVTALLIITGLRKTERRKKSGGT